MSGMPRCVALRGILAGVAESDDAEQASDPEVPGLVHVFTIRADIDSPRASGPSPTGQRIHIPISGGTVDGPRLTGRILPGGSDWPVVRPDGCVALDARYSIEADDGTLIHVHNQGLRAASAESTEAGRASADEQVYMRTAPVFDAPDGAHAWLRDRLFVASAQPHASGVRLDVYEVT